MKFIITILLFISISFSDKIVLKDGTILEGYVLSRTVNHVTFKSKNSNHYIKTSEIALADFNNGFSRIENNHLQTKVLTLQKEGKLFTLFAMIHTADKSFYRRAESVLDKNDVVLYEAFGVDTNEDLSVWRIPNKRYYAHPERYESYGNYFHFISKLLGLSIQLEELQTDKPFWVASDISQEEFNFYLRKRQLFNLIKGITEEVDEKEIKEQQEMDDLFEVLVEYPYDIELRKYVKNRFAHGIIDSENMKLNSYLHVILTDRNNRVLQDIYECLLNKDLKKIGICYGAFHGKGIADSMVSNGFIFVSETWVNAWSLE